MFALFKKRQNKWWAQNLKYLRYVFNDHFVLVLLFLIGFLAYQYAQVIETLPEHWLPRYFIAVMVSILTMLIGRLATFVERADQQFLLAKEQMVQSYLRHAVRQSLFLPILVILMTLLVLSPLVSLPFPFLVIWGIVLIAVKYVLLVKKSQTFIKNGLLQWRELISYEEKRQTVILKVFSQFTDVKGLHQSAKRRKYLDVFLPKSKTAYAYLFIRTFLRRDDYLLLSLRLVGLAILSLIVINQDIFALLLSMVFDYLLVFQLLPLVKSQDYQILSQLYPLSEEVRREAANQLIRKLVISLTLVELIVSFVTFQEKIFSLSFLLIGLILGVLYPKVKQRF
jgi:ABC-2 type transport system permease protein